jgi:hypothetical protein
MNVVPFEDIGNDVLSIKAQVQANCTRIVLEVVAKENPYTQLTTIPMPISLRNILQDQAISVGVRQDLSVISSQDSIALVTGVMASQPLRNQQQLPIQASISDSTTSGDKSGNNQSTPNTRSIVQTQNMQTLAAYVTSHNSLRTKESRANFIDYALPSSQAGRQSLTNINNQFQLTEAQVDVFAKIYDLQNGNNMVKTALIEDVNAKFTEPTVAHLQ